MFLLPQKMPAKAHGPGHEFEDKQKDFLAKVLELTTKRTWEHILPKSSFNFALSDDARTNKR